MKRPVRLTATERRQCSGAKLNRYDAGDVRPTGQAELGSRETCDQERHAKPGDFMSMAMALPVGETVRTGDGA
jgi:hypothetical protein